MGKSQAELREEVRRLKADIRRIHSEERLGAEVRKLHHRRARARISQAVGGTRRGIQHGVAAYRFLQKLEKRALKVHSNPKAFTAMIRANKRMSHAQKARALQKYIARHKRRTH